VVRLKGGDPFVFGRGAEEVDAVGRAGIEVDVVPGLSSALAGPALAGVPITERGTAASALIISGHRVGSGDYDWVAVARAADTIVVLMAASTAPEVARRLLDAGRPGCDPVAVVHRAGRCDQQVLTCDLGTLAARPSDLPSPCVVTIGAVAARAGDTGPTPHLGRSGAGGSARTDTTPSIERTSQVRTASPGSSRQAPVARS
jgi:siroheme synthase